MGREIELKIPLTEQEYNNFLQQMIFQNDGKNQPYQQIKIIDFDKNEYIKQDSYYSKYHTMEERKLNKEPSVIRIRTEITDNTTKAYFTIKTKTHKDGIEVNKEDESFIENPQALEVFFKEAGYYCWFNKEKKAYSILCSLTEYPDIIFHLELVIVNGLKYAEIEVTSEKEKPEFISEKLNEFAVKLGLDISKKDERSWYKIITQK